MKKVLMSIIILLVVGGIAYFTIRNSQESDNMEAVPNTNQLQDNTVTDTNDKTIINKEVNNKKIMQATLHTNMGDITIEFGNTTPRTVDNFIKLAKEGFYNGTKFHRVIKGFMNQGGDPLTKDDTKSDYWGTGGPEYKFDDELTSSNRNDVGTISMANSGPNTNGSQFFINVAQNNFLDTKHVVFGKVTAGMDVVNAINNVATGANDRPIKPVILESISLK